MRVDIYDRDYVGSAEWQGPGDVRVEVADEGRRSWFERYFQTEDSFLMGSLGPRAAAPPCSGWQPTRAMRAWRFGAAPGL